MTEKKERTEMQGHNHKTRVWKVLGGKQLVILETEGKCSRCDEIRAEREEKERAHQISWMRHPDQEVQKAIQAIAKKKDWEIEENKNGTFYDITAADGGNTRISTGKMSKKQKEEFTTWLSEHDF
jgi:hypothetical protein